MDQLFAPWRIEWVERDADAEGEADAPACPFCRLPDRENDRESKIVARSERSFVLLNNYPYNPGHAMVIPDRHTGEYGDLAEAELLDHARLKQRTFAAMGEAFGPDGFNAGLNLGDGAGGSVDDHLHTHVVPRWEGDTNFMPVIGDTKVIVQAVAETYDRLRDAFAEQAGATRSGEDGAVSFA